jgi:hypothetical protein
LSENSTIWDLLAWSKAQPANRSARDIRFAKLLDERKATFTVYPIIKVTGTNGKGSVCAMLEAALIHAGKRTGLFISPFLTRINERFRINGKDITDEALENHARRMLIFVDDFVARHGFDFKPSYFEMLILIALEISTKTVLKSPFSRRVWAERTMQSVSCPAHSRQSPRSGWTTPSSSARPCKRLRPIKLGLPPQKHISFWDQICLRRSPPPLRKAHIKEGSPSTLRRRKDSPQHPKGHTGPCSSGIIPEKRSYFNYPSLENSKFRM